MDIEILSTKSQFEEFIDSVLWKDLTTELDEWLGLLAKDYDEVSDLLSLGKIQGRREAIAYMQRLPHNLIQILEIEKEGEDTLPLNFNESEVTDDD